MEKIRFLQVEAEPLLASVVALVNRIDARFPNSNLRRLSTTLVNVTEHAKQRVEEISKPNLFVRFGVAFLILFAIFGLVMIARNLDYNKADQEIRSAPAAAQLLDAALQTFFLLGGGAFFLITLESRIKRGKLLAAVHELRSFAHIIDMHQLTKSPDHYVADSRRTKYSPEVRYDLFEVRRYLDYCSEMLSMVGKVAVLYVEKSADPVVLDAVDQIEDLTTGLSRKIWQKLMIFTEIVDGNPRHMILGAPHPTTQPPLLQQSQSQSSGAPLDGPATDGVPRDRH